MIHLEPVEPLEQQLKILENKIEKLKYIVTVLCNLQRPKNYNNDDWVRDGLVADIQNKIQTL